MRTPITRKASACVGTPPCMPKWTDHQRGAACVDVEAMRVGIGGMRSWRRLEGGPQGDSVDVEMALASICTVVEMRHREQSWQHSDGDRGNGV